MGLGLCWQFSDLRLKIFDWIEAQVRIYWNFDRRLVFEDELAHLDVPGGHNAPALARDLGDHHGDAVPSVSAPVSFLTLPAAVGDGVTSGTFGELPLPSHGLLTLKASLTIRQRLDEQLRHDLVYPSCVDMSGCKT